PDAQRLDEGADDLAEGAARGRLPENAPERNDSIPLGTDGIGLREGGVDGAGQPRTNRLEILEALLGRVVGRQRARQEQHTPSGQPETHELQVFDRNRNWRPRSDGGGNSAADRGLAVAEHRADEGRVAGRADGAHRHVVDVDDLDDDVEPETKLNEPVQGLARYGAFQIERLH